MNSLADSLIPWAILGLLVVGVFVLAALASAAYGWVKARGGTSKLALLGQLVLEHVVASIDSIKATVTAEAAKAAADGKVTPEELRSIRDAVVRQVMDTLPGHAKAIGSALLGDLFGNFVATRVDAVLAAPTIDVSASPQLAATTAAMTSAVARAAAVSPQMPRGAK